jgi:hypothetical protein
MVYGWESLWFSIYLSTSGLRGKGPLHMIMTYILSDAISNKKQEYIWFRGGDVNSF